MRLGHSPVLAFEEIDLKQVDGVLGFIRSVAWVDKLRQAGIAAVTTSNVVEDIGLLRVGSDEEAIGRIGARHLIERGAVNFAFAGYRNAWFSTRRGAGFEELVKVAVGVEVRRLDVQLYGVEECREEIGRWLLGLTKPTALMTANDVLGLTVMDIATELGLRVPEHLAVLGVDNNTWLTQMGATPMSSVEPDWRRVGFEAASLLDAVLDGKPASTPEWIAPVGLVARQSTDIMTAQDPVVREAITYIKENCSKGLRPEDVVRAVGVSRRNLELHIKRALAQTLREAILQSQVERAKQLLGETDESMYNIAGRCGFTRQDRFFVVFKQFSGMTPGQYRRRMNLLHD